MILTNTTDHSVKDFKYNKYIELKTYYQLNEFEQGEKHGQELMNQHRDCRPERLARGI